MTKRRRLGIALGPTAALALLMSACGSDEAPAGTLTGTVLSEEFDTVDLPDGSTVEVQFADISLADAPASVVASQTIDTTELPVDYSLEWDDELDERFTYAVSARVEHDGKLLFINDTAFIYEPGDEVIDVVVISVDG